MFKKILVGLLLIGCFGLGVAYAEAAVQAVSSTVQGDEDLVVISKAELRELLAERSAATKAEKVQRESKLRTLWAAPQNIFSIGYDVGWPFHGINFAFWPGKHGFGLNFYASSGSYYQDQNHFAVRYYYSMQPNLYFTAGLGRYSDERAELNYTTWDYDYYNYDETLLGLGLGIRVGDYTTYEFGYGTSSSNTGESYSTVNFGVGIKFDFKV